jgi:hypothetical protein
MSVIKNLERIREEPNAKEWVVRSRRCVSISTAPVAAAESDSKARAG